MGAGGGKKNKRSAAAETGDWPGENRGTKRSGKKRLEPPGPTGYATVQKKKRIWEHLRREGQQPGEGLARLRLIGGILEPAMVILTEVISKNAIVEPRNTTPK